MKSQVENRENSIILIRGKKGNFNKAPLRACPKMSVNKNPMVAN